MKKELMSFFLFVLSLNLISAYGSSIGQYFDQIGGENVILVLIFFASFTLINWLLSKSIKENKSVSAILSLCSATLVTYGAYRSDAVNSINNFFSGFYFSNPFSNFYFSDIFNFDFSSGTNDILLLIVPLLLIGLFIFLLVKIKEWALIIFGGIFVLISLAEIIFDENRIVYLIGTIFLIIGLAWSLTNITKKPKQKFIRFLFYLFIVWLGRTAFGFVVSMFFVNYDWINLSLIVVAFIALILLIFYLVKEEKKS